MDNRDGDSGSSGDSLREEMWEPLGEGVLDRMLDNAFDPLALPMDLSVIPDPDEQLVEDGDGQFDDAPDSSGEDSAADGFDGLDDLGDLFDDGAYGPGDDVTFGTESGEDFGTDGSDGSYGGDVL